MREQSEVRDAVLVKIPSYGRKIRSEEEAFILVLMMSSTFSREMIPLEGEGEMIVE